MRQNVGIWLEMILKFAIIISQILNITEFLHISSADVLHLFIYIIALIIYFYFIKREFCSVAQHTFKAIKNLNWNKTNKIEHLSTQSYYTLQILMCMRWEVTHLPPDQIAMGNCAVADILLFKGLAGNETSHEKFHKEPYQFVFLLLHARGKTF